MADNIPTGSPKSPIREKGLVVRVLYEKEIPVLKLSGVLDEDSFGIFITAFDPQEPHILDFKDVSSIDMHCMRLLAGMSLDYTFLIRNVSYGTKLLWGRLGMDPNVFIVSSESYDRLRRASSGPSGPISGPSDQT